MPFPTTLEIFQEAISLTFLVFEDSPCWSVELLAQGFVAHVTILFPIWLKSVILGHVEVSEIRLEVAAYPGLRFLPYLNLVLDTISFRFWQIYKSRACYLARLTTSPHDFLEDIFYSRNLNKIISNIN